MKKLITAFVLSIILSVALFSLAEAAVRVRGNYRHNGTYVQSHYRSSPNRSKFDNWSTKGNYNPYTGKKGYVDPFRTYRFR